jgi:hypothetical protein
MAMRTWAVDALDSDRRPFAPEVVVGRRRRSRRVKGVAAVVAAAVFGTALGYLVNDEVQANDRYDRAKASLLVTRQEIRTVSQELAVVRRELALVTSQVGNDSTALSQDAGQLKAAQSALAAALAHVSRQTTQIGSLHVCLGGVEQALNALAVKRQAKALLALSAVSTSCTRAASGG